MPYVYLILAFTINATANVLLKMSAGGVRSELSFKGGAVHFVLANSLLILGLGLFACNVIFYYLALRSLPLSLAYPIMVAASFLLISGYAHFFLSESITVLQIIGYALILLGVILVLFFKS